MTLGLPRRPPERSGGNGDKSHRRTHSIPRPAIVPGYRILAQVNVPVVRPAALRIDSFNVSPPSANSK